MYKEDLVQKAIVNYLKVRGFLFTSPAGGLIHSLRTQRVANSLGYKTGCGDLIVFIPNGCLHIEVKRPKILAYSTKSKKMIQLDPGGKQGVSQKEFQASVEKIPGHYYLVASDVGTVDEFIKKMCIKPY